MNATKTLPDDYSLAWEVDLDKNKRLMWGLQFLALPWSLVVLFLLGIYTFWVRPDIAFGPDFAIAIPFSYFLIIILVFGVTLVLHELVHGALFWFYTRERPTFGFKGVYAYAAAPGWYFNVAVYWLVGLGPLLFLSLLGMALLPFLPLGWLPFLLFALFVNATGSIGDLYIITRMAFEPAGTMVYDYGTGFRVFRRAN